MEILILIPLFILAVVIGYPVYIFVKWILFDCYDISFKDYWKEHNE